MIVGTAGTGKTTVLKGAIKALNNIGDIVNSYVINPKSVTGKELFGYTDLITGNFVHGICSK